MTSGKKTRRTTTKLLSEYGQIVLCRLVREGVNTKTLAYAFSISRDSIARLVKQFDWKVEMADAGVMRDLKRPFDPKPEQPKPVVAQEP